MSKKFLNYIMGISMDISRMPRLFLPLNGTYTVKKVNDFFPSQAGVSFTKLSLAGNNLIVPGQGEFG
jgi:hypothetical protein